MRRKITKAPTRICSGPRVVPARRLFLLGDHRADSNDSRYFLSEQSGTVAATAVQARVLDDRTGLLELALTALLGFLLTITALVLGITARVARRRSSLLL